MFGEIFGATLTYFLARVPMPEAFDEAYKVTQGAIAWIAENHGSPSNPNISNPKPPSQPQPPAVQQVVQPDASQAPHARVSNELETMLRNALLTAEDEEQAQRLIAEMRDRFGLNI